ncbi:hypothetical protein JCM6882_000734 [Rhodosporidiobolus microsporus]
MFSRLFQASSTSPSTNGVPASLALVLLSEEDEFDPTYVEQGQSGGRSAARKLHKVIEAEVGEGVEVLVYHVVNLKAQTVDEAAFFDGFCSSTSKLTLVVPGGTGASGSVERIAQLVSFYLPFPFLSNIFLGFTSSDALVDNLESLSEDQRHKITVLDGGHKHNRLVDDGGFKVLHVEPGLFSEKRLEREKPRFFPSSNGSGSRNSTREAVKGDERFVPTEDFPFPDPIPAGSFEVPKLFFDGQKPCRDFYLYKDGCGKRTCHYSHDYPFTTEQWLQFPLQVASQICPQMRDRGACTWGEACPYEAKSCPWGRRCHFRLAGLPHSTKDEEKEEEKEGEEEAAYAWGRRW